MINARMLRRQGLLLAHGAIPSPRPAAASKLRYATTALVGLLLIAGCNRLAVKAAAPPTPIVRSFTFQTSFGQQSVSNRRFHRRARIGRGHCPRCSC